LPRVCPKCTAVIPSFIKKCICGYEIKAFTNIVHEEGELTELRGKGTKATGPKNTVRMGQHWVPLGDFYAMLLYYGAKKGYSSNWASNQYRQAAGTWPNAYRDVYPKEPIPEVSTWIISKQIAYANRRKKLEAAANV
jgi:hypothetical protein